MSRRVALVASLVTVTVAASAYALQRPAPAPLTQASPSNAMTDDHMAHMMAADQMAPSTGGAAQQDNPKYPPSAMNTAARLAASPRHGEWVKIPAGDGTSDEIMAWIVYPESRTKAPVVVVVHEIFGLSSWVRGVADQVAAEGFIAIAPDFLSRVRGGPSSVELSSDSARRLISGVNAAERNRVIAAAANYAMQQPAASPLYAVIGYCWGGQTTFMHATNGGLKGYSGGVAFYGLPYTTGGRPATATSAAVPATVDVDSLRKITKPVMLLSGSKDARIGAAMPGLEETMKSLGKDYVGINYEGAVHGFLRAQGDPKTNRDQAVHDGWPRTIAFLKKNLGVK